MPNSADKSKPCKKPELQIPGFALQIPGEKLQIPGVALQIPGEATDSGDLSPNAFAVARPAGLSDAFVNKDNALVRASYQLTLNEQRLLLACIAKLDSRILARRPGRDQISRIKITAAEYADTFEISPKAAYGDLRAAADALYQRSVIVHRGKQREKKLRWLTDSDYQHGEGYVEIGIHPEVASYLTLLRQSFTSYRLRQVSRFTSVHAIRLYEMLIQFRQSGFLRISLAELQAALDTHYDRWQNFKTRVIEPAMAQITTHAGLTIQLDAKKKGRVVDALEFRFQETAQGQFDFDDTPSADAESQE